MNNDLLSITGEQVEKESDMWPVSTERHFMGDSADFNGHGRPFGVGCGALMTPE